MFADLLQAHWTPFVRKILNFAPDTPSVEKRNSSPPLPAGIPFQHAFALAVDVQERICHVMLALRAATDVIIRKIRGTEGRGLAASGQGNAPRALSHLPRVEKRKITSTVRPSRTQSVTRSHAPQHSAAHHVRHGERSFLPLASAALRRGRMPAPLTTAPAVRGPCLSMAASASIRYRSTIAARRC